MNACWLFECLDEIYEFLGWKEREPRELEREGRRKLVPVRGKTRGNEGERGFGQRVNMQLPPWNCKFRQGVIEVLLMSGE